LKGDIAVLTHYVDSVIKLFSVPR